MSSVLSSIGSTLSAVAHQSMNETVREASTGDTQFISGSLLLYFFELRVPASVAAQAGGIAPRLYYPLILNPQSIELTEPFSVDVAMTQGGGLFVEENGIIQRTLRISGTFGFAPKGKPNNVFVLNGQTYGKSYTRTLPANITAAISGMRHLQYLQDAVIRTYADLKRNPATAADTTLIFHDSKKDEHWVVVPRQFSVTASSSRPLTEDYTIDLLIVGPADNTLTLSKSEDAGLLQDVKDVAANARKFINMASAAVQDLTNLAGQLTGIVQGFAAIMTSVSTLIDSATNFVTGVTTLVLSPLTLVTSTANAVDSGVAFYANLIASGKTIATIPDSILQSFRQIGDALDVLGQHPECFQTPAQAALQAIRQSQQIQTNAGSAALAAAAASTPPASFQAASNLGTALLPGDALRAAAQTTVGAATATYSSTQQYTVSKGDTLANLAARFLGDARLWQYIAAANGLKPPFLDVQAGLPLGFVSENSLPGALGLGQTILIPNNAPPPASLPLLPVLGATPNDPPAVHILGRDLLLGPVPGTTVNAGSSLAQLDLVINTDQGSTDFMTVQGIPNLQQGLTARLTTDKGSNVLYQQVGIQPIVGFNIATLDLETIRFRIQEALAADPRVASVSQILISPSPTAADGVVVDATVQVLGFNQPSNVQVTS